MKTACGSLAYAGMSSTLYTSPFPKILLAPEVIDANIRGYIGPKSDVW